MPTPIPDREQAVDEAMKRILHLWPNDKPYRKAKCEELLAKIVQRVMQGEKKLYLIGYTVNQSFNVEYLEAAKWLTDEIEKLERQDHENGKTGS